MLRAARLGVLELLEHDDAGAAGDDEAVAVLVVGAAGLLGRVVELRRHGAHGIEQHRQRPVELLAAAGEHDVLLAPLDELGGVADAVCGRRAGRRDRVVDALDLEAGGQRGRRARAHRLRHLERADLAWVLLARRVGGGDDGARRRAARAHDDAGALVDDVFFLKAGVADRLIHRNVVPADAVAHETARLARHLRFPVDVGGAVHLAAKTELGVFFGAHDARLRLAERREHFLAVVSDRGNDAHARDDHTSHPPILFASNWKLTASRAIRHRRKRARKAIKIKD